MFKFTDLISLYKMKGNEGVDLYFKYFTKHE